MAIAEDVQLTMDKSFTDDSVTAGGAGTHTFTLVVTNDGASDADGVSVTDAVDPRLVVSDVSAPAGVDCSASAGQLVSCSKDHLASGGSFTITVTYDVDSTTDSDPSVSNTAHVASDEDAAQDTDTVAITEDVDLEITKTFADDEVTAGAAGTHTFDLVVENLGDSDADNVTIVDTAPAGLTFLSEDSANCSITLAGNLSCTFAHLAGNSSTTITVTYDVDSTVDAGEITNSATVTSDEDTDTASDTVAVIEDVDLEITKTFADDEVTAGAAGTHTFDLVVENLGDSDADNVTIVDTAPAGLTFLSEDSANCSITLAGNLSCTFAHLAGQLLDDDHRHLRRGLHRRRGGHHELGHGHLR